jgi:hypothetical protein
MALIFAHECTSSAEGTNGFVMVTPTTPNRRFHPAYERNKFIRARVVGGKVRRLEQLRSRMIRRHPKVLTETLVRYRHRWKIERLFAWLHNSRGVVIRWQQLRQL